MFDEMLWAAIRREPIIEDPPSRCEIRWDDSDGIFVQIVNPFEFSGWLGRASAYFLRTVLIGGHLLKICPAPTSRGKDGELCDTRFVASRPNQAYCSARCQTRAATRAYRSGDSTPVAKMLTAKDRAGRKSRKGA